MPHQALGDLVEGSCVGWLLPCENDGWGGGSGVPLGWWAHGEAFRVGSTQDMSLSRAVRSGVLCSPLSLPQCPGRTLCPVSSGSAVGRVHCVWFALLKGCKGLLWGDWCQAWGKCWHTQKVWEPSLKLADTMGLRGWVLFGNIWHGERMQVAKWRCCGLSETLEGLCCRWQLRASPSVLRSISPCCFAPLCLIYERGFGWWALSTQVLCVPTCWAGRAWWGWCFPAVLKHHCTIDRAADGCEHHSCFLFAINAGFVPWTLVFFQSTQTCSEPLTWQPVSSSLYFVVLKTIEVLFWKMNGRSGY